MAYLIGFAVGIFVSLGSAYVLRRAMAILDENDAKWSPGQAVALASMWSAKLFGACFALYFAQKAGYSTAQMGIGLPVGIIVAVLILRSTDNSKSDK